MKWTSLAAASALAVFTAACEKHDASELPVEHAAGEPHAGVKSVGEHDASPAETAKPEAVKPAGETKPGEAPKFFPENK